MKSVALWIIAVCLLALTVGAGLYWRQRSLDPNGPPPAREALLPIGNTDVERGRAIIVRAMRDASMLISAATEAGAISMTAVRRDINVLNDRLVDADLPKCLHLARIKAVNALKNLEPIIRALAEPPSQFLSAEDSRALRGALARAAYPAYGTGLASVEKELVTACQESPATGSAKK